MSTEYDETFAPETPLTGAQRAAVALLALGETHGRPIWECLDEDEIKLITTEILHLGTVEARVVEKILTDLATAALDAPLRGGAEEARALLSAILPSDVVEELIEQARGPGARTMYQKLADVNPVLVANYLKNEHPQTVTVVLSRLPAESTARILTLLPPAMGEDVAQRILTLGHVPREILDRIDQTLRSDFIATLGRQRRRNPIDQLAEIVNHVGRGEQDRFIDAIERVDQDVAEKVRATMFSFERLSLMPSFTLQVILRHVDRADLVMALKGAPDEVRQVFYANMTQRARRSLQAEMESLGPVRLKLVDEAQAKIASIARALEQSGEIQLVVADDEDKLVE